jgi:hypothetical protein
MPRHGTIGARVLASQNAVYAAVLALLALVAGLTWHARRSERSHQTTVQNALRDYAAFAAWQFRRDAQGRLSSHMNMGLMELRRARVSSRELLPPPRILTDESHQCACGWREGFLFAFRVDLPDGRTTLDRAVSPNGVVTELEQLASELGDE